jgi:hypothetical protein
VVDVDAADQDAPVSSGAAVVQKRRDAAGDREGDHEPEAGEHRPFAARTQVVVEM